ncbi:DUF4397 domain-containing protein [Enterovibrio sp. ZSDZ35]|uniref:DUF4397 domain-containing protein n=1 Tax=Enterovibrio qingdaonensis TaxID=2899818 RepID=A0ABT5QGH4_9GAMM|nr:DUF4397 domain-containing protein [Enterovibrio sp. ZSDZ35]MDD1780080.1 DUF4397 domain-containing protein [Enterovibrio sp. ZSDZ35]
MKKLYSTVLVVLGLALVGCGGGESSNTPHTQAKLRVIHAGSDAPKVNVAANGTELVSGLDYGKSSGFATVNAQSYAVDVNAVLPENKTSTVLQENYTLGAEKNYSAVAVGSVADSTLEIVVLENADEPVASGYARVQVLHGTPAAPKVDVYVTAPGGSLVNPASTLSYRQFSDQISVPAGDYQIRITPAGSQTVVYDSGTATLASGSDSLFVAIPNVYAGNSRAPVALLAASGTGASVILDQGTGGDVRVVHAVADAPAVNVTLNNSATPAVTGLVYLNETDFVILPEGEQTVTVSVQSNNQPVIQNKAVSIDKGVFYNAIALGSVDNSDAFDIELLAVEEDRRKVATEAKLSLVHGSVSAGTVDVYVTPTTDISSATPAIAGFEYKQSVTGVAIAPGSAVVSVTPAGSKTVAIGPLNVTFEGGKLYGAIAQDAQNGGAPLTVNGFDELN